MRINCILQHALFLLRSYTSVIRNSPAASLRSFYNPRRYASNPLRGRGWNDSVTMIDRKTEPPTREPPTDWNSSTQPPYVILNGKPLDAKLNGNFANASLNFRDRHRPLFQLRSTLRSPFLGLAPSFIFDGFLAPIDLNKETEGKGEREERKRGRRLMREPS